MKVFFHADDACAGESATKMIMDCWEAGGVDGFSILANELYYSIIEEAFRRNPEKKCAVGVHLNLSDGKPVTNPEEIPSLVDSKKYFKIDFFSVFFLLMFKKRKKAFVLNQIYKEWDAQICSVKQLCGERSIASLDGHNHIHMIPPLFEIVSRLAAKHSIRRVRFSNEKFHFVSVTDLFSPFFWINFLKNCVLWVCVLVIKKGKYGTGRSDKAILGIQYSGRMSLKSISAGLQKSKKMAEVEVIFHPGWSSYQEAKAFSLKKSAQIFFNSDWRMKEYDTLKQLAYEPGFGREII